MLRIDTRELRLQRGLIMPVCSRREQGSEERKERNAVKDEKGDEEEEAEEDEEETGEKRGEGRQRERERSNKRCSLGCRAGLRCLSRSTSLPPWPPSLGASLRGPRCAPFTSGSYGEGARPRQSGVAERCIYVMRALVARMHSQWRRNTSPFISNLVNGNTTCPIANERILVLARL